MSERRSLPKFYKGTRSDIDELRIEKMAAVGR